MYHNTKKQSMNQEPDAASRFNAASNDWAVASKRVLSSISGFHMAKIPNLNGQVMWVDIMVVYNCITGLYLFFRIHYLVFTACHLFLVTNAIDLWYLLAIKYVH